MRVALRVGRGGRVNKDRIKQTNQSENSKNERCQSKMLSRLIWFLIFSVLTGLTLRDIVDLVSEYRGRPVDVATTLRSFYSISFPDV